MTCFPDKENKTQDKAVNPILSKMIIAIGMVFFVSIAVVNTASAASVNWTEIQDLITGVGTIMPSITTLITNIIAPMILLVVVGFLVGLFDSLLGGISNALNFRRF